MAGRWASGTYLGRLQADLERWRDEGLLTSETAARLLDDARRREEARLAGGATRVSAQAGSGAGGGVQTALRLGLAAAALAALGVLSFVAANWADMAAGSKLMLLGLLEFLLLTWAAVCKTRGNEAGAEGLALFGAASFAGALALIGQAFNLDGTTAGFLFAWTAAAVAVALALDLHWTRLFAVVLASAYSWMSLVQNGFPEGFASPPALALLGVLGAASWLKRDLWAWRLLCVTLTTHLCAAAFHLAERAGAEFIWGAAIAALAGAAASWLADRLARARSVWGAGWAAVTLGAAGGLFSLVLVFAGWEQLGDWLRASAGLPAIGLLGLTGAALAGAGWSLWSARRVIGWHVWSAAGALYLAAAPAHFYPSLWEGDASAAGFAFYGALGVLALAASGLAARGWRDEYGWGARVWTGWAAWIGGLAAAVCSVALAIALTEQTLEDWDLGALEAARRWAWASWFAATALALAGAAAMWVGRSRRFWALAIPGGVTLATAMLGWPIALAAAAEAGGAAMAAFFAGVGVLAVLLAADAGLLRHGQAAAAPANTAVWPSLGAWLALTAVMAAGAALTPSDWASFIAWSVFMAASATALWRGLALGHRVLSYGGLAGLALSSLYLFVIRLGGLLGAAGVFLAAAAFLAALAFIAARMRRKAADQGPGAHAGAASAQGGSA